ncbi:MAG: hypothetical protein Ct9H300mP19_17150 [Dehalococcoidia bacterium]|nr:MAG: hypothetical protein Ct9H300mP19_17150 [Dehalococcoidia bacterium]
MDAPCPLVTRVHNEAKKYTRGKGKKIVPVGHGGHQEVIGTTGQAEMELVDERQEWQLPNWGKETEVAVLTRPHFLSTILCGGFKKYDKKP